MKQYESLKLCDNDGSFKAKLIEEKSFKRLVLITELAREEEPEVF